ncbi:MAG TPA: PA2779 family protein [Burkholderiales bacterium]|jgi:hypothetical protein|nr:PA2779 family protein [Burkholderiales bacterium]
MKKLSGLLLALVLATPFPPVYAGMISTPSPERARVQSLIERPEVAAELQKFGLTADQAKERVNAMSEAEVASLSGKLEQLPAGGALSNQDLLLIIIVVLLVIVLVAAL